MADHIPIIFAQGHDQTTLNRRFPKEPSWLGVEYAREIFTPAGSYVDAAHGVLVFRLLKPLQFDTALLEIGWTDDSDGDANLTIRLPNRRRTVGVIYNVVVKYPRAGRNYQFDGLDYTDVRFELRDLEAV